MMKNSRMIPRLLALVLVLSVCCCLAIQAQALEIIDEFEAGVVEPVVVHGDTPSNLAALIQSILAMIRTIIDFVLRYLPLK